MSEEPRVDKRVAALDRRLAPWVGLAGKLKLLGGIGVAILGLALVIATEGGKSAACGVYLEATGATREPWSPVRDRFAHAYQALAGVADARGLTLPDPGQVSERRPGPSAREFRWQTGEQHFRFLAEQDQGGVWTVTELEPSPPGWCDSMGA